MPSVSPTPNNCAAIPTFGRPVAKAACMAFPVASACCCASRSPWPSRRVRSRNPPTPAITASIVVLPTANNPKADATFPSGPGSPAAWKARDCIPLWSIITPRCACPAGRSIRLGCFARPLPRRPRRSGRLEGEGLHPALEHHHAPLRLHGGPLHPRELLRGRLHRGLKAGGLPLQDNEQAGDGHQRLVIRASTSACIRPSSISWVSIA